MQEAVGAPDASCFGVHCHDRDCRVIDADRQRAQSTSVSCPHDSLAACSSRGHGHNPECRATLRDDEYFATKTIPSGNAAFALLWTTATVPTDNNDETDGHPRDAGLTLNQGSVIRIVDMLPGRASPMHRSNSIDYGIVLSGQIELEVDDGAKTRLGPGDSRQSVPSM